MAGFLMGQQRLHGSEVLGAPIDQRSVCLPWPFRLHATYDESIARFLDVFEAVDREVPLDGLNWFFDHAETVSDRSLERIRALGGGIAVQHRMAFQGKYFVQRYGAEAAQRTPPIRQMLKMGIPVRAGTDATRVASYNPWVSLHWLVTGRTLGGLELYPEENRLSRMEALRLYTVGSSWFSTEHGKKGAVVPGQLADLAVLSEDYFSIPEDRIQQLQSVLTVLGGRIVHGTDEFGPLAPPSLPVLPEWSPVGKFAAYGAPVVDRPVTTYHCHLCSTPAAAGRALWGPGCDCFAF